MGEINRKYVDINELISLSKNAFRKLYDGSNIQNEQVKFECKIERLDMHIMLYMAFIVDNKEYKYEVNSYIHNLKLNDLYMFRKGYVNIYKFYEGLFLIRLVYDVDTYHDILKKVLPYYNEGNSLQESFDLGINDYLNKDNKKLIKKR